MLRRRRDYEAEFPRYCPRWRTVWEFRGNVYFVNNLLHPKFISDWWHMYRGFRVKSLWRCIKHPIEYWSESRSKAEFAKDRIEIAKSMNEARKALYECFTHPMDEQAWDI